MCFGTHGHIRIQTVVMVKNDCHRLATFIFCFHLAAAP